METGVLDYPQGLRNAEMTLVRMLKQQRSWADIMDITDAIWRIQFIAEQMQKERDVLYGVGSCDTKPT